MNFMLQVNVIAVFDVKTLSLPKFSSFGTLRLFGLVCVDLCQRGGTFGMPPAKSDAGQSECLVAYVNEKCDTFEFP